MVYQANSVANYIIDLSKKGYVNDLTNMKMQRLLFIIEAWHIELYNKSFIQDIFSMWKYGPVIPNLYYLLKMQKSDYICQNISTLNYEKNKKIICTTRVNQNDYNAVQLINKVIQTHDKYTGTQLSNIILKSIPKIKESEPINREVFINYIDKCLGRTNSNVIEFHSKNKKDSSSNFNY